MSEPTIARLVHYSGRLQGVGFRATTRSMARSFHITGYVRNRADGRVEVLVEGSAAEVERFLQAIRDYWRGYVEDERVEVHAATGSYERFEVVA